MARRRTSKRQTCRAIGPSGIRKLSKTSAGRRKLNNCGIRPKK